MFVCMCRVCVCMHVFVNGYTRVEIKGWYSVFSSVVFQLIPFRSSLLLNLECTVWARVVAQTAQVSALYLQPFLPQRWGYKSSCLYVTSGDSNSGLHSDAATTLTIFPCLQPPVSILTFMRPILHEFTLFPFDLASHLLDEYNYSFNFIKMVVLSASSVNFKTVLTLAVTGGFFL